MSSSRPTVLILAAGENSRFFPFNTHQHKGSLELLGEPLIVRTLRNLEEHGFQDVVIVVSEKDYGGKGLSEALHHQHLKVKISFVLQSKALGMGNAVLSAKEMLGEQFAVVFPNLFDAGEVVAELMKHSGKDGALAVSPTNEPWLYGIVTVDGKRVMSIIEKPAKGTEPSTMKAQGMYLLPKSFIDVLEQTPEAQYSFETAQDAFFKNHEVNVVELKDSLPPLKYPWHLFDTQKMLFESMKSSTDQSAVVAPTAVIDDSKGPVIIQAGARVGHAAKIVGPCFIGENVLVGDFCFVRGSSIEHNAVVGANTEIVRSIIFPKATVHFGYAADSIIGSEVKIGAGLITANVRHDHQAVEVQVKDEKVSTGQEHFGALIGDRTKLGVRVTTMPGVVIGADAIIYPTSTVFENISHNAVVKTKR